MSKKILNIAAGKGMVLDVEKPYFLVNIDTMFYLNHSPEQVERAAVRWNPDYHKSEMHNIKVDAFEFMERTVIPFDRVCIYRFLEHVDFTKVLYFIYLVSTVIRSGGIVDVIVPNYEILARMILNEFPLNERFEETNILLTTELLNEPSCPHASIWTPARATYFWELENRFRLDEIQEIFEFDGRNIYLRFKMKRV
jgi:hypothetical protein